MYNLIYYYLNIYLVKFSVTLTHTHVHSEEMTRQTCEHVISCCRVTAPLCFRTGGHAGRRVLCDEQRGCRSITEFSLSVCVPPPMVHCTLSASDGWVNTDLRTAGRQTHTCVLHEIHPMTESASEQQQQHSVLQLSQL